MFTTSSASISMGYEELESASEDGVIASLTAGLRCAVVRYGEHGVLRHVQRHFLSDATIGHSSPCLRRPQVVQCFVDVIYQC